MIGWLIALAGMLLVDDARLRWARITYRRRQAVMAAAALGPRVEVDGIMLPAHDDDWRWSYERSRELCVGFVHIEMDGYIRAGGHSAPPMERTAATQAYCSAVWRAYRSRIAQQR